MRSLHRWFPYTRSGVKRIGPETFGALAIGIPLGVLVIVPLALLALNSFRDVGLGEIQFSLSKLTLSNYITAYGNPRTWKMMSDSFIFAAGSSVVAFLLGGAMAFLVERTDTPLRRLTYAIMFVPLIVPGMLLTIAWVLLLSPSIGLVNVLWHAIGFDTPLINAYSMPVMWWVQGVNETPLTFLLLGAALRRMDPALEEAALTCGASSRKAATRVTLRLIAPAVAGVALLQFVRGLEALEVPLLLGLNAKIVVFTTNIMHSLKIFPPEYGLSFTYSMSLIILASVGLLVYFRAVRRSEKYTVVTGKGYRPRTISLGNWKIVSIAYQVFFAVVAVGLPVAIVIWASLVPGYQAPSMEMLSRVSLNNYVSLFQEPGIARMTWNTIIMAGTTAIVVMLVALFLSFVIFRTKIKGGKVLDGLSFMPYAIPSIVMGVAFMFMFLTFKNPIYGTVWILVIAHAVHFLPLGTRFTHAGLLQLHKELDEAAKTSGASFRKVFFHVIAPILKPSLIGGGLYVFISAAKIFPLAIILGSPKSMVLSVQIWQLWAEGEVGLVSALAVVMVAGISILTLLGGARRMGRIVG